MGQWDSCLTFAKCWWDTAVRTLSKYGEVCSFIWICWKIQKEGASDVQQLGLLQHCWLTMQNIAGMVNLDFSSGSKWKVHKRPWAGNFWPKHTAAQLVGSRVPKDSVQTLVQWEWFLMGLFLGYCPVTWAVKPSSTNKCKRNSYDLFAARRQESKRPST